MLAHYFGATTNGSLLSAPVALQMADKAPDALQIDATGVVVDLPADAARDGSHVMPLASASIASRVTYAWIGDLLRLGAKRPLEIDDVYRMDDAHSSKGLSAHFGAAWQREHEHAAAATPPRQASILRAMFAAFGPTWLPAGMTSYTFRLIATDHRRRNVCTSA